ncbi:MAG: serine/threonine protein kinase [Actinomycetia bacterium]|nr:serine/threonine protein kinase [Actinomycetes bacterium]
MLGLGLVEVQAVPYQDPTTAIMQDPQVPEAKRYCGGCDGPVGRGRGDRPGRPEGFCPSCGARFSFTPKLAQGDLVGGQYEVLGCLAHGGLGWVYLAEDRNVSDRWVVLKGLLDSGDPDAMAAALAERRFLATVEHPNIVRIHNFVQHRDSGYIVMEYVGGRSLKDLALERRRDTGESLPLAQVIAYGVEILRALGYLHGLGLVYCDFKPDNVLQTEEQLRLIDLGGVRRIDDLDGPIYGTTGYQAPEIADEGPSVGSDLYTVGRTLAVLSFEFHGYTGTHRYSLPDPGEVPLLTTYESYDRLLRRATHPDPDLRFWSAEEMADQLTGVLREVLAATDGQARSVPSTRFGPETRVAGLGGSLALPPPADVAAALPVLLVDATDPAATYLAGLSATPPEQLLNTLPNAPRSSPEVRLRLARANLECGYPNLAHGIIDELENDLPGDWRARWYRGVTDLAGGWPLDAVGSFDELYSLLPGEAAPKLALAFCAELGNDPATAARHYETVWRTDQTHFSAAFGLARVRLAGGDRAGAVTALDLVPATSSHHTDAQLAALWALIHGPDVRREGLIGAGVRLEALISGHGIDGERRERLTIEVLGAALDWVSAGHRAMAGDHVLGIPLVESALRAGLEQTYRALARLARDPTERIALVDQANAVRPITLV